jgi:uncharacterized protein (DUF302 family)
MRVEAEMTEVAAQNALGIISVRSSTPFNVTVECLLIALERRGMMIHCRLDYAREAADAGIILRPTQLFVFGYREAEAPVILRSQDFGIELPQKILVWEDAQGLVWLTYNDPLWLGRLHCVSDETYRLLEAMAVSLAGIVADVGCQPALLVPEIEEKVNPAGVKGLGELGRECGLQRDRQTHSHFTNPHRRLLRLKPSPRMD